MDWWIVAGATLLGVEITVQLRKISKFLEQIRNLLAAIRESQRAPR